jgi:pimeloyl-ACP methyl ester carboxylesterase
VTFAPTHKRLDDYALAGLVRLFAYSPETAALLPLSIAEGLKGNYAPLAGQSQLLTGDLSELRDNGMQTSVICAEDADLLVPRPQDAATVLGTVLIDVIRTQCEVWPRGARPDDFHAPLKSDKPILVLEGEFDPVTPPRYGEQLLKGLTNARLLVAKARATTSSVAAAFRGWWRISSIVWRRRISTRTAPTCSVRRRRSSTSMERRHDRSARPAQGLWKDHRRRRRDVHRA